VVPALAPVADYLLIGTCITGNFQLVPLYLLYTLLDVTIPAYILLKQQEKPVLLKWLALQRFLLRHLMFCAFIQIMGKNNNGWSKKPAEVPMRQLIALPPWLHLHLVVPKLIIQATHR